MTSRKITAKFIGAVVLSAMIAAQTQAALATCGQANGLAARNIAEVQSKSIFAIAVAPRNGEAELSRDNSGNDMRFIGNSFLVERTGLFDTHGYFATALHNLNAVCRRRDGVDDPAPYWLITPGGQRFAAQPVSDKECDRIAVIRQNAGGEDVVFVPDVAIVEANLPSGDWKPILVGSPGPQADAANGNVQTLNKTFSANSTPTVGLPVKPWQNAQHAAIGDVWTIAGGNLGGTSGSPFVAMVGNRPVALGVVTNSIPPTGIKIINGNFSLTANETAQMVASQYQSMEAKSYSLLFGPGSLANAVADIPTATKSAQLLQQWEGKIGDPSLNDRIATEIVAGNFAATVSLVRFCNKDGQDLARYAMRRAGCSVVMRIVHDHQCHTDIKRYDEDTQEKLSQFLTTSDMSASQLAVSAVNAIRLLSNASGKSAITKTIWATAIDGVLSASDAQGVSFNTKWHGTALYDLALTEKAAGVNEEKYQERLEQALVVDDTNTNAREAFVLATASSGNFRYKEQSLKYLPDVAKQKKWKSIEKAFVADKIERIAEND